MRSRPLEESAALQGRPAGRAIHPQAFFCAPTRNIRVKAILFIVALTGMLASAAGIAALDAQTVAKLGGDDAAGKVEAIHALVASGDEDALAL